MQQWKMRHPETTFSNNTTVVTREDAQRTLETLLRDPEAFMRLFNGTTAGTNLVDMGTAGQWLVRYLREMGSFVPFTRDRQEPRPEPAAVTLPVEPVPEQAKPETLPFTEEYAQVAQKLGFKIKCMTSALFSNWLQREEIPVYDNQVVEAYLHVKGKREYGPTYITHYRLWERPLRAQDAQRGWAAQRVYDEPVPIEALKMAERVTEGFKHEEPIFTVLGVKKDPFLCVRFPSCLDKRWILMHWSEPSFALVPKSKVESK